MHINHAAPEQKGMSNDSFDVLEKEYLQRRNDLISLDYHFLVHFGEMALREGHMRRAIEITREALVYAENQDEQALVYLSLSRMYRMMIHMKNARAELKRAFRALRVPYPKVGVFQFIESLGGIFSPISTDKREGVSSSSETEQRKKILVALYEEAGLSAYYMYYHSPLLWQISLRVRNLISEIGPSFEMVNYLGATATVFAIYNKKFFANYYLSQTKKVAEGLNDPIAVAKYRSWEILSTANLDDARQASQLTEELLREQKADLTPYNLRLICTTLSNNYTIRGKTELSLRAIDHMLTPYDNGHPKIFSCNKTFIEWYRIPALSFRGEEDVIQNLLVDSRAIFSSTDDEKWQITLFLGNVFIYYYLSPSRDSSGVKDVLDRFRSLRLSPKHTYLEGQHFWIGKAYLFTELYFHGEADLKELENAIRDVGRMTQFQTVKSHFLILKAHLYFIKKRYNRARSCIQAAILLAQHHDNDWALYEAEKLSILLFLVEKKTAEGELRYEELRVWLNGLGWKGCLSNLEKLVSKYK